MSALDRLGLRLILPVGMLLFALSGCSSPPEPHAGGEGGGPGGTAGGPTPAPPGVGTTVEVGASDSIGPAPGSPGALYGYRFRQTDPGSDRFTYYDRYLSFYFRPAPDALHFQIENKQNSIVWIDWEKTTMLTPDGPTSTTAHASTTYSDRFGTLSPTQIGGLQRYSDYVFPMDYLRDPGTSGLQVHRQLFPEDETAPNYNGREFGVDFAVRVDNQPRTYSFRFRVISVLPR